MGRVDFSSILYHCSTPAIVNHATTTFHTQGDIQ